MFGGRAWCQGRWKAPICPAPWVLRGTGRGGAAGAACNALKSAARCFLSTRGPPSGGLPRESGEEDHRVSFADVRVVHVEDRSSRRRRRAPHGLPSHGDVLLHHGSQQHPELRPREQPVGVPRRRRGVVHIHRAGRQRSRRPTRPVRWRRAVTRRPLAPRAAFKGWASMQKKKRLMASLGLVASLLLLGCAPTFPAGSAATVLPIRDPIIGPDPSVLVTLPGRDGPWSVWMYVDSGVPDSALLPPASVARLGPHYADWFVMLVWFWQSDPCRLGARVCSRASRWAIWWCETSP